VGFVVIFLLQIVKTIFVEAYIDGFTKMGCCLLSDPER